MVGAVKELAERECLELLASRVAGRVALVVAGEARVFPVNYLLDGGGIVFRTDEGSKLDAARTGAVGTFEVDVCRSGHAVRSRVAAVVRKCCFLTGCWPL